MVRPVHGASRGDRHILAPIGIRSLLQGYILQMVSTLRLDYAFGDRVVTFYSAIRSPLGCAD